MKMVIVKYFMYFHHRTAKADEWRQWCRSIVKTAVPNVTCILFVTTDAWNHWGRPASSCLHTCHCHW